ncbi:hypothetical protein L228DRAFT_259977 [Xylona heveae TC161]|uniref:BZIP domain-containing protein n=1 Tax=Xylona heveae (strain CBS 132557 / TC161) TaxID=1328760 RepID=A0A165H7Q9_XYLHT|nr:hypothetical protein L228DRAFT_259977 [Xylona heveae TC161]KZF23103.1 hypothetical protein L228DRAFT_259977 [Xylona heveae TC161]
MDNSVDPENVTIPLTYMPQQACIWKPGDDWTGVVNQKERRRLQNRQNQRIYRSRQKGHGAQMSEVTQSSVSSRSWSSLLLRRPSSCHAQVEDDEDLKCAHAPPHAREYLRQFEATARQSYLSGFPRIEHLISLSRLNVHRAINENILAAGMAPDWMKSDDSISIFNLVRPGFTEDLIPPSLRPTPIQRQIPHHPWLDFFPFPCMRDNLIAAGDTFDDEDLCHDLMAFWDTRNTGATLLVWGQPWDPRNWEVTEEFARKWGWLLQGCPELLSSTDIWRMNRGEKPLAWRQILRLSLAGTNHSE